MTTAPSFCEAVDLAVICDDTDDTILYASPIVGCSRVMSPADADGEGEGEGTGDRDGDGDDDDDDVGNDEDDDEVVDHVGVINGSANADSSIAERR